MHKKIAQFILLKIPPHLVRLLGKICLKHRSSNFRIWESNFFFLMAILPCRLSMALLVSGSSSVASSDSSRAGGTSGSTVSSGISKYYVNIIMCGGPKKSHCTPS